MSDLLSDLKSSEPSVVCAAIQSLEIINPEALKANIVSLLVYPNAWVRCSAVRAMCHWDKTEAIRYLGAMLFSNKAMEKEVAVNSTIFFPFDQIEPLLLKFLTVERNQSLIQKAGVAFMANPDKATAYRLFEAKQATRGLRSSLIEAILMGVLNSLFQAELDTNPPEQQLKIINQEYEKKRTKLYINHFSAMLGSEDPSVRLNAALKLCELKKKNITEVDVLINEYLKTEEDITVINKVRVALYSNENKEASEKTENKNNLEDREKFLASINKDNYSNLIMSLLPNLKELSNSEQIKTINLVKEYGSQNESKYVLKCLDVDDYDVQQAVIDCVSKIDQDALKPHLPNLIKSESDQVKLASINAFALFDKKQALSILSQMMTSVRISQRKSALFCLENLDFASVSDIITSAVKQEKEKSIRQELYTVLLDNINENIFYDMYFHFMSATFTPSDKSEFKFFLNKYSEKLALQNPDKKKDDYWEIAETRLKEEREIIAQREAYRLEKIQSLIEDNDKKEKAELIKFGFICHGIGFILTILIWFVFMAPNRLINIQDYINRKTENETIVQDENQPPEPIPTSPIIVKGLITDSNAKNKQAMFLDNTGKKYLLTFSDENSMPEKDKRITAQVLVEDYENSVYIAEVINLL